MIVWDYKKENGTRHKIDSLSLSEQLIKYGSTVVCIFAS